MPKKLLKSLEEVKQYALHLLGIRDYSRHEMRQKLMGRGLGEDAAEEILKKLESGGLINDDRYARLIAVH